MGRLRSSLKMLFHYSFLLQPLATSSVKVRGTQGNALVTFYRYYKSQKFLSQLDQTYWPILSQFDDDQETLDTFHKVVGSLIVLPAPLTVKTLDVIINEDEGTINPILHFLHSVFFIPLTADEKFKCGICLSETIS
ncbi:uncharacterized protein ASPGLDRAFT_870705 [Aspergillus glaucus CBS 516.65]|uniref:Uncharacterized protein n=1 Tax=Aspergillus glaucus CBS 516.65 TaxID=1160497 RepID=A0A1L9V8Z4_ASPGL|nr:hypothetical protein ASPGLDRAFT_870705 [Aspergillus glaucus CBS 516.65]OJJ80404.1 hypothetical protein ASPGLDRAFT_870705 [Aspergillus glaucus CBS 516.65]